MSKAAFLDFVIEIIRRIDGEPGFKVLPRRWVVERTFGWLERSRSDWNRDFEGSGTGLKCDSCVSGIDRRQTWHGIGGGRIRRICATVC
jgi:transposase